MELVVMNYATSEVTMYTNIPDEWESEQIEEYLFETLDLNESDIHYMASDNISARKEKYPTKAGMVIPKFTKWKELKEKHPDALLLFRCGNFYEAYHDDAVEMTNVLRVSVKTENGIKTASFPYHALDAYLPKLIRSGYRIAIFDRID